jgi:hypothetical protein
LKRTGGWLGTRPRDSHQSLSSAYNSKGVFMKLPQDILEEGLRLATNATIYGIRVQDMSRQELIAIAVLGWKNYNDTLCRKGFQGRV